MLRPVLCDLWPLNCTVCLALCTVTADSFVLLWFITEPFVAFVCLFSNSSLISSRTITQHTPELEKNPLNSSFLMGRVALNFCLLRQVETLLAQKENLFVSDDQMVLFFKPRYMETTEEFTLTFQEQDYLNISNYFVLQISYCYQQANLLWHCSLGVNSAWNLARLQKWNRQRRKRWSIVLFEKSILVKAT